MKHSLRRLFKNPAFALTAVITVGAAIGANALIFSVVNGVILKPLPYADPASLVGMWHVAPGVMPGPLQQSAGTYFMERLGTLSSKHIKEIRGKGLWIGIELHREAGGARRFCEALQKEGLLCKETHDHVIRIAPPLTIQKEEIDWAMERLQKVLTTLE